jgi:hypothetical protein
LKKQNKDIWVRASVVGSLWASVEIITGSFFHNLQLPFAGTLLAVFSVVFVIAIYQIWPYNGLIWRAGIICALMKSISPSAVIIGPMTGIFLEAILIETSILIFRNNLLAYLIAGILAVLSALLHKILTLLIIYGWDAVDLLSNVFRFIMKQLKFNQVNPITAVWIISITYALLGIFAALTGYWIGKKALQEKTEQTDLEKFNFSKAETFFKKNQNQEYSVSLLIFNIVAVLLTLYLINIWGLITGVIVASLYFAFVQIRYKHIIKRLYKAALWFQLITLIILASLFYVEDGHIAYFSIEGLSAGIEMAVRAIVVILGFSALSIELRNPLVEAVLSKRGAANLYPALGMAFSALPAIISDITKPSKLLKKPFKTIVDVIIYTDALYLAFKNHYSNNNKFETSQTNTDNYR